MAQRVGDRFGEPLEITVMVVCNGERNEYKYRSATFEFTDKGTVEIYNGDRKITSVYPVQHVESVEVDSNKSRY